MSRLVWLLLVEVACAPRPHANEPAPPWPPPGSGSYAAPYQGPASARPPGPGPAAGEPGAAGPFGASGALHGANHDSDTGLGQAPPHQTGLAAYYADSLAGNATASGEPYRPSELSAAHRTLPFGTVVDVVREDGRWVRVRVNDRGPFTEGRIIDLSRRAAELIGLIGPGVAPVRLYLIHQPGH